VFENKVLRRIFGPKREEVAEGWRRMHNEELHKKGHQIKEDELGGAYSMYVRNEI
jgi:hypothetical protein